MNISSFGVFRHPNARMYKHTHTQKLLVTSAAEYVYLISLLGLVGEKT